MSHWVGMANMGHINVEWDREMIDVVCRGDVDALVALDDDEVIETAGNGALELKNWLMAMSIFGDARAELIAYEAVNQWVCGCGFMELKAA